MPDVAREQLVPAIVIEPARNQAQLNLREVWEYRDLLYFLTWRDISVRYKQTVLGAGWAVIQPFLNMVIFSFFFGKLAQLPSEGVPYPIFSFAALLPWQYFATAMASTSGSLVNNSHLFSKVYFPRLLLPLATIFPPVVDFCIAFIVLLGMMVFYHIAPTWNVVWLPALMLLAMVSALGVGLWTSALNVKYRDIRYIVPFLVQFGMFISPVVYPSSLLPEKWRMWYGLNPMAGVIEGFRWALLGSYPPPGLMMIISVTVALLLLVSGVFFFRRSEKSFADIV